MSTLRPLSFKIRTILIGVVSMAFLVTALMTGRQEYLARHAEFARILQAQGQMAQSLIEGEILEYDHKIRTVLDHLRPADEGHLQAELQKDLTLYDPYDSYFVLNRARKVVAVSAGHEAFLGLDFSGMEQNLPKGKISPVYHSAISDRSVIGVKYPFGDSLTLIYERNTENILPVLRHIDTDKLIPRQSLFVLSAQGVVIYHADRSLVAGRYNLAFELKKPSLPDRWQMISYRYQGEHFLAFRKTLAMPADWTVYFQIPAELMQQAIRHAILRQFLVILAFFVLITAVLQFLLNQFFSRPVDRVVKALGNYVPGQKAPVFSDHQADGILEFAEIGAAVNEMAEKAYEANTMLQEREERISLLLNSTAEAIYGLDTEGRCTFCNTAFREMLHFGKEEELIGKKIHALIHHSRPNGSAYPAEQCIAHQGFLKGMAAHSDLELFFRADGSSFPAECWSHPIEANGKVEGAVVTFIDISARKEAQDALLESESRYRTLVENIDLGITLIDKDHKIVMANKGQGKIFHRSPELFIGKHCFREFEKREAICPHCPGVTAVSTGRAASTIAHGMTDDGRNFSGRVHAFPITSGGKLAGGFIEVIEDITDRLKADAALAEEKERLAVTLRSIGDGVITTDVEGRILLINKVAENLTGWTQQEAAGRPLTEVFHIVNEQNKQVSENPVEKVLTSCKIVGLAGHTMLISRNGVERRIADSGAPIRDKDSNIIGVVLVFRDVTDQLRMEREVIKGQKLESIGVLAGGIAHDFNNILVAILGNLSLATSLVNPENKLYPLLKEAEKASHRAKDLTQQLLTFSKGGEPVKETASLPAIIKDSANFIMHGRNALCHFDLPEELWLVNIDKGQMSQVIQNLILNACQAMPDGGEIRISCRNIDSATAKPAYLDPSGNYVRITVSDSGPGIPEKIIGKIFDPYFSTKKGGSGLGLAITHSIIDKHGGHISVNSAPDQGTEFTIYLPVSSNSDEKKAISKAVVAGVRGKILVMDDEAMVRDVARAMLEFLGHQVIVAPNGEETIALFKKHLTEEKPFDLVIMDLTIPGGMGGKEAVRKILEINPQARVVVSSGYSTDPIMANYRKFGFVATIHKPYQLETLENVLHTLLR